MPDRWASAGSAQPQAATVPERLRFTGARALSLPVGQRRVLVQPGEELQGISEAERHVLWRTGLFEAVG
ncbi:hypothetical protein J2W49_003325 [Hydrogenophaga palleronii]|uniref:Uncharacterized protein n=1 Tax=Hydrogenophaga palleronii TaxID=65655 RepID=A0ABU1WQ64_9BURK|nr:hypothetical protein [Hydrogenophaga palleronii]MDR7151349.1 hypothetical protein [Hydrogenophaga palleronii]